MISRLIPLGVLEDFEPTLATLNTGMGVEKGVI